MLRLIQLELDLRRWGFPGKNFCAAGNVSKKGKNSSSGKASPKQKLRHPVADHLAPYRRVKARPMKSRQLKLGLN